jgi:iron complex outermembrane receptor protein
VVYENRLTDADTLRAIAYLGNRTNVGYLAIPLPQQNGVRNAGGIPDLDRVFGGLGIRWTRQAELAGGPLTFTTGLDYDRADEDRKGYRNELGVQGALKRDEQNLVDSWGGYVQGEWRISDP